MRGSRARRAALASMLPVASTMSAFVSLVVPNPPAQACQRGNVAGRGRELPDRGELAAELRELARTKHHRPPEQRWAAGTPARSALDRREDPAAARGCPTRP
jgi:hypothetical protein